MSPKSRSLITRPVASTAAMMIGKATGKNSNGSITSLARVLTAIAEKTVPTAAIPRGRQHGHRHQHRLYDREVEEHREDGEYYGLDDQHEKEAGQHLAEVDGIPADRGQHQPLQVALVFLHGHRAGQPQHAAENEGHPEHTWGHEDDETRRGLYGEVENDDDEEREHQDGYDDVLASGLQQDVFPHDRQDRSDRPSHALTPVCWKYAARSEAASDVAPTYSW